MINQKRVLDAIKPYLDNVDSILVAFSGGVDSTVLLHALVTLKKDYSFNLRAIYIHHGISTNADEWANHCQTICQQWHVPLDIAKVKINLNGNIEAQAREARYLAIKQHLSANQVVMTAQHLDDQSETFLLALKRGSGPTGLSAMPNMIDFAETLLIRPLLSISRNEIEDYAHNLSLNWIEDESNQDARYDRNFLRLHILPQLNQRWPHFNQMVSRSATICAEETALIAELLSDEIKRCIDNHNNLELTPLLNMSVIKRNAILRAWFKYRQAEMPSRQQLNLIWQTVVLAKEDANPQFILNQHTVRRYQNRLYLLSPFISLHSHIIDWNIEHPLALPDNLGLLVANRTKLGNVRYPTQNEKITIRFEAQGKLNIVGRNKARTIKKLWQEFGIPPWMRQRIPLVYYDEKLITAVGVFVTHAGQGDDVEFIISS